MLGHARDTQELAIEVRFCAETLFQHDCRRRRKVNDQSANYDGLGFNFASP